MPLDHEQRDKRLNATRGILRRGRITSQGQLLARLRRRGFRVTQSSVSRDLRELGVVKTNGCYALPEPTRGPPPGAGAEETVAAFVWEWTPAGPNLLVLRTAVGAASRVALALDEEGWREVVGTVAGDDTVFVAVPGQRERRRLEDSLRRCRRKGGEGT